MRPPSISHRTSIRFLPAQPAEPTDTLVLNGGGATNLFTDFRPLRANPVKCEWAFAGVKKYFEDGRCQWNHLVDNRAVEGETEVAPDIGHCEILQDGSEVERGEMLNPETGAVEQYEEVWRDEEVPSGSRVVVLRLQPAAREGEVTDQELEVRGIFVLVGGWAQVVMRGVSGVSAERWQFTKEWVKTKSFGDQSQEAPHPKGDVLNDTVLHMPAPDTLRGHTWTWEIVEDYVWSPQ